MFLTWFNYDSIWYFNNGPRAQSSFRSLRFQAGWSPKPSTFGEGVAGLEGLEGLEGLAAEAMRREHMLAPPVDSACFSGSVTTRDSQVTFQWDVNSLKKPLDPQWQTCRWSFLEDLLETTAESAAQPLGPCQLLERSRRINEDQFPMHLEMNF